ncbi:MAG: CDP-diacylglycerol--glycerol-3-phosphate 3-phosphatidyltransferase [Candidatus Eisenbacteria bacterium]
MNLPNGLTVARLILGPIILACLIAGEVRLCLYLFLVAMFTDLYDGYLARISDSVTEFGKLMDPLADKVLVSLSLIGFLLLGVPYVSVWMVVAIVGRELLILGWRTGAVKSGDGFVTSRVAKWKTASQMAWVALVLLHLTILSRIGIAPTAANDSVAGTFLWAFGLAAVILTLVSGVEYVLSGRHTAEGASS